MNRIAFMPMNAWWITLLEMITWSEWMWIPWAGFSIWLPRIRVKSLPVAGHDQPSPWCQLFVYPASQPPAHQRAPHGVLFRGRPSAGPDIRVDSSELPIRDRPIKAGNDQADHFILFSSTDAGKTFDRIRDFGDYGEMYMSLLRLQDKRLLLTFTVRDLKPPLGVRAIPGIETDDGFEFDFGHDRIMLDTRTGPRFQFCGRELLAGPGRQGGARFRGDP